MRLSEVDNDLRNIGTSGIPFKVPNFPGASRFKGTSFHSSRWDHSYDYRGKRVAVIGTGATAIQVRYYFSEMSLAANLNGILSPLASQIVPAIVDDVKSLHVFQVGSKWHLFVTCFDYDC